MKYYLITVYSDEFIDKEVKVSEEKLNDFLANLTNKEYDVEDWQDWMDEYDTPLEIVE